MSGYTILAVCVSFSLFLPTMHAYYGFRNTNGYVYNIVIHIRIYELGFSLKSVHHSENNFLIRWVRCKMKASPVRVASGII